MVSRREVLRHGGAASVMLGVAGIGWTADPAGAEAAGIGAGTTFDGLVNDRGGQLFNATNPAYGAAGDSIRSVVGGSVQAGSVTFTQQTASSPGSVSTLEAVAFDAGTDVGKVITIQGAGPAGGVLSTTVTAVASTTTVTLADAATTGVSDAAFAYGTDDTGALLAALDAAGASGTLYLPAGIYMILGGSNDGRPILHEHRGGIRGRGGKQSPGDLARGAPTVLLCGDSSAGLVANGCARYEGFLCDGNDIAGAPLQIGTLAAGAVAASGAHATFFDVHASRSASSGWAIYGARHSAFYDCGTTDNAQDGVLIDGGSEGLDFVRFQERGALRYGIRGDDAVASVDGTTQPTRAIRFHSAVLRGGSNARPGVSKVHLRGVLDWRFPDTIIDGAHGAGATVDLDQSRGFGVDLSGCLMRASVSGTSPGRACVQIGGVAPADARGTFVKTDECDFAEADTSVSVLADPGGYRYSAIGGWSDATVHGPWAAAGLPAVDALFSGRTGPWQQAAVLAPWSGTVSYRIMGEGWVDLKGSVQRTGLGSGPILTLPAGYRPDGSTRRAPGAASFGAVVVSVATTGDVTAAPVGTGAFPPGATVSLDGISFAVGRA